MESNKYLFVSPQEAGATPEQELSFALATAIGVLEYLYNSEKIKKSLFEKIVGRISFFVNSGMRFVTETAKMASFTELWNEICLKDLRFQIQSTEDLGMVCKLIP